MAHINNSGTQAVRAQLSSLNMAIHWREKRVPLLLAHMIQNSAPSSLAGTIQVTSPVLKRTTTGLILHVQKSESWKYAECSLKDHPNSFSLICR